jgi:hypothetical protein
MTDSRNDGRVAELAERLRAVEEELGELIVDVLREAVAGGATRRPEIDARLTRARNAVSKAVRLLEPGSPDDDDA